MDKHDLDVDLNQSDWAIANQTKHKSLAQTKTAPKGAAVYNIIIGISFFYILPSLLAPEDQSQITTPQGGPVLRLC